MTDPIPDALKQEIQQAYSRYIEAKGFKARYGQRLMIAEITKGLMAQGIKSGAEVTQGPVSVVEAGTGTGKTVAYLLAAIPVARYLGKSLVVATGTVALQEQIIHKDLPDLKLHSGLDFDFQLVKGRGRYLCLSKLDMLLNNQQQQDPNQPLYEDELAWRLNEEDLQLYQTLGEAYTRGDWNGERDSWETELNEQQWRPITTDHRQCTNRRCSYFNGCCFFQARQGMEQASCIVANHDLVLSDLALGGGAILPEPEDTIYIFDEGHHLPDKALQHFSYRLRVKGTQSWLKQLPKTLSRLTKELGNQDALVRHAAPVDDLCKALEPAYSTLDEQLSVLEQTDAEQRHTQDQVGRRSYSGNDQQYVAFEQGVVPEELRTLARRQAELYGRLQRQLDAMSEILKEAMNDPQLGIAREDAEKWFPSLGRLLARTDSSWTLWRDYSRAGPQQQGVPQARWFSRIDTPEYADTELNCSPILAADTLQQHLWQRCAGAVVTSATLTALGEFQRLMMRTGLLPGQRYCRVPSPFDYAAVASIQVPKGLVSPTDADAHDKVVAEQLARLITHDEAALVLFTSWRQMLRVQELVEALQTASGAEPAAAQELHIQAQGKYSKQHLLEQHKARVDAGQGSVIFGLASFAEGVDLPGAYLTHVIIARVPFSVPNDPVERALHDWVKAQGGDPFMDVSVPDASVRLIQACGRLIRSENDHGRITLLDNRVLTRRYGRALLDSLPPFARLT